MKKQYSLVSSALLFGFFFIYIFLLLNVLVLSRISFGYWETSTRAVNMIPFYTISFYLSGEQGTAGRIAFNNLFWNILMFVPLGLYLPVLKKGRRLGLCPLWIALFSIAAEIAQWILAVGAADIDDVILNALGGLIGVLIYKLLIFLLKEEARARKLVTAASVVVGIPALYLLISNLGGLARP